MRKIIHIDMDAFFASVEQRDQPEYQGKPLAVGYAGMRGVVAAASYEARKYGVKSAMASKTALQKCPHLIFVMPRFEVYKAVSMQIMDIFHEYTDLVEPLSLDEAFLDVTVNRLQIGIATQIAMEIKQKIKAETGLTASAGVSYNKFLAKIASAYNKPDGLFVVKPKDAELFVEGLAIERFFGVGKVTAQKMHEMGIKTGKDLKQFSEQKLISAFGKAGRFYFQNARAIDERPVEAHRTRKSISSENTFETDIDNFEALYLQLNIVAQDAMQQILKKDFKGRTVTLKIKFADFKVVTRSRTFLDNINDFDLFYNCGCELLRLVDISPKVRLIGLGVKNNESDDIPNSILNGQLEFEFTDE